MQIPFTSRSVVISTVLAVAICALLISFDACAQIVDNNVFDEVLRRYQTVASTWSGIITTRASWLFWFLVLMSMVWTFGMMALRKADLGEFFAEFVRFTIFTGFFFWLLTNGPRFATDIIASLRQIAGEATGLGASLTPSGIVDVGFRIFDQIVDRSDVLRPVDSAIGILVALVILGCLALVAINMVILLASGWILAYGGIFFLGFGGARWTSDIAINYYKTVLAVAAQLFAMVLLVGVGQSFLDQYYNSWSHEIVIQELAVILIVSFLLLVLTNKIPALLAGIISGASVGAVGGLGNLGGGALLAGAGMGAAAMAAGGSMIAAGAAQAAGGASALMAAARQASANMESGSGMFASRNSGGLESGSSGASSSAGGPLAAAMGDGGSIAAASSAAAQSAAQDGGGSQSLADAADSTETQTSSTQSAQADGESAGAASGSSSGELSNDATEVAATADGSAAAAASSDASGSESGGGDAATKSDAGKATGGGKQGAFAKAASVAKAAGAAAGRATSTAGRFAADMGINLARGTGQVAREKAMERIDQIKERIGETFGGQVAQKIDDNMVAAASSTSAEGETPPTSNTQPPQAAPVSAADEVAEFVNKKSVIAT